MENCWFKPHIKKGAKQIFKHIFLIQTDKTNPTFFGFKSLETLQFHNQLKSSSECFSEPYLFDNGLRCCYFKNVTTSDATCDTIAMECDGTVRDLLIHKGVLDDGNTCNKLQVGTPLCCSGWTAQKYAPLSCSWWYIKSLKDPEHSAPRLPAATTNWRLLSSSTRIKTQRS